MPRHKLRVLQDSFPATPPTRTAPSGLPPSGTSALVATPAARGQGVLGCAAPEHDGGDEGFGSVHETDFYTCGLVRPLLFCRSSGVWAGLFGSDCEQRKTNCEQPNSKDAPLRGVFADLQTLACRLCSAPRLLDANFSGLTGVDLKFGHESPKAGRGDHEFVAAPRQFGHRQAAAAARDDADLLTVDEHRRAAHVGGDDKRPRQGLQVARHRL